MSEQALSWPDQSQPHLIKALTHVNDSRRDCDPVEACRHLAEGLNQLWNGHWRARPDDGQQTVRGGESPGDHTRLKALVTERISSQGHQRLADSPAVRRLTELDPMVMNHHTLEQLGYDPSHITIRQRKEAETEHRQLRTACQLSDASPGPEAWKAVARRTAQLLYVIRSNIAHGEKTLRGPDPDATTRNARVTVVAQPAFEIVVDEVLARPSRRLAVYGTLRPGECNYALLASHPHEVTPGRVLGRRYTRDGLPSFDWRAEQKGWVDVQLIESPDLPDLYESLDRFEGGQYERILVPIRTDAGLIVANIYAVASGE